MASRESNILKQIMLDLSGRIVLWRNNRGVAKQGSVTVRYGVGPNGASDLIGYRTVTITADMVGQRIAQFAAVEVKKPGGRVAPEQHKFVDAINRAGGIACIADCVGKVEDIL